ncbi:uncharacterized protein LOC142349509 [Convolutriloba macropyga]|uniref:uncharacterized protein LOC142349509 n=1 Tax=Convolutriloba macropyga TaxID=536237 RepID=UPI003F51DC1B
MLAFKLAIFYWPFCFLFDHGSCLIDCDNVLRNTDYFTGLCSNKWKNLQPLVRPGQPSVGYAWVKRKVEEHFKSKDDAEKYIDEQNGFLGVINPGVGGNPLITIVDKHHTLSALDYSGYDDISVSMNIICDYRNLTWDDFYQTLESQSFIYILDHPKGLPNHLPQPISPSDLPIVFEFRKNSKAFSNDPWRALSSFSRKVEKAPDPFPKCKSNDDKYCERCYIRVCQDNSTEISKQSKSVNPSIPFFEFKWGYFLNYAAFYDNTYWPSFKDWQNFMEKYLDLETDFESMNVDSWQDAADLLVPLCRSEQTGSYRLPNNAFPNSKSEELPGYVQGTEKLPEDPTCGQPTCG